MPAFYAEDMLDDPDLERLHAERLAELKAEAERRVSGQAQTLYGEQAVFSGSERRHSRSTEWGVV